MSKFDEYSYHEALDRTSVIMNIIDDNLSNHPVVLDNEDVRELIDKAQEELAKAYQLLGEKSL
jgi:hypothetical protein